nr:hypothetical protein [Tanacetum cinerariifolium]
MDRDTVQLETAVSTISQEYLLEFTSEYGISEALHPKPPEPEDRIVDFPKGKCYTKPLDSLKNWNNRFFWVDERVFPTIVDWRTSAPKDGMPAENTYSSEAVRVLDTHRTPIQKHSEALFCLVGLSRRYYLGDEVYPTFLHDDDMGGSSLDFANENPSQQSTGPEDQETAAPEVPPSKNVTTIGDAPEAGPTKRFAATNPLAFKELRKRGHDGVDTNAPPKVLTRDHADPRPTGSTRRGKSLAAIELGISSKGAAAARDLESKNTSFASMVGSPEGVYQPKWGTTNGSMLDTPEACQDLADHRCAEMDARLDVLSIDFDEELYPHMLTAIAGRRWMIERGLRLAVMKCGESIELRQAFADVVSAGIAKGMSVKNLKYPIVDQLEGLKDAPMDVIMASLHLENDTGDDAPQWVCDLHPSYSQLTVPVYPEVRDPIDPWACKEEILLADAIAANVSRAEKKKKYRVGLAILLADVTTQTKISDEASPQLLRSSSLPVIHSRVFTVPFVCFVCSVRVFAHTQRLECMTLRTQSLRPLELQPIYVAGRV